MLFSSYKQIGAVEGLQEAIAIGQEAVGLTPADSPSRLAPLNNLTRSLSLMYKCTNALEDLGIAILMAQEMANAVSHDDRLDWALCSSNLSALLRARFQRVGDLESLEQAVQGDRAAVEEISKIPGYYPHRAGVLHNLALSLTSRFRKTRNFQDLQEAIQIYRNTIQADENTPGH